MLLPQGMSSSFVIGLSLVWLWRSSHGDHSQYIILLPFPFVVFKLKLSWRNLNLLLLVLFVIENSCQFCCCCCCYPTSPLKIFFFCLCRLNHSFFPFHVLCLGSLLWALIFGTSLMPQVDLTMPAKSGSAEQTRRITLPVLQAILQLIYLIWWLLFFLNSMILLTHVQLVIQYNLPHRFLKNCYLPSHFLYVQLINPAELGYLAPLPLNYIFFYWSDLTC